MLPNPYNVKKIFIDMDGCIVDDINMFKQLAPSYNIESHIKKLKILGKKQEFVFPLIHEAIKRNLFEKARPTQLLLALTDILIPHWKSLGIEVEILSSTMKDNPNRESLERQKLAWCKKYTPQLKVNLVQGSAEKQHYASDGVLLIDDYDRTISQFINKGGYGICHTTLGETMLCLRLIGLTPL